MRLLLRADASAEVGAGHLARMLALAEEAVTRGWSVRLAGDVPGSTALFARFAERLADLGVDVVPADASLGALAAARDAVVVDHYGLGEVREEVHAAGAVLVSFEDGRFGRRAADVVVDTDLSRLGRTAEDRPADGSRTVLTGPRYAPLRRAVSAVRARRERTTSATAPSVPRVLVVLGGSSGREHVVESLLTAVRDTGVPCVAEALVPGEPAMPEAREGQRFTVAAAGPGLPDRLADADLVVSAAGVTLLELCCAGVPTALVCLVDNQRSAYTAAVDAGLAAPLGDAEALTDPGTRTDTVARLTTLLTDEQLRARLAASAVNTVDGGGAGRVLDAVASAVEQARQNAAR